MAHESAQGTQLYCFSLPKAAPAEALTAARRLNERVFALVYTPEVCWLGTVDRKAAQPELERVLAGAYEARFFGPGGEVRWVEGQGAAVITERDARPDPRWQAPMPPRRVLARPEQTYLLWGTREQIGDSAYLVDHRVHAIDVTFLGARQPPPGAADSVPTPGGDHLVLVAREYLGLEPREPYGNVSVLAERLVDIRPWK